jgi:hypothetical protein
LASAESLDRISAVDFDSPETEHYAMPFRVGNKYDAALQAETGAAHIADRSKAAHQRVPGVLDRGHRDKGVSVVSTASCGTVANIMRV